MSNTIRFSPRAKLMGIFILSLLPIIMVMMLLPDPYRAIDKSSYLVFHNLAELFSVMVSLSVFGIGWYTYSQSKDQHALFIGTAFLAMGLLDIFHTLSSPVMPAFITPNSGNKSTQFWVAARLIEASTFLASAFLVPGLLYRWITRSRLLLMAFLLVGTAFVAVIFYPDHLPVTAIPGGGITPFKREMELVIIGIFACSFVAYGKRFQETGDGNLLNFMAAFVICIFAETLFASYKTGFDTFNVLGHLYRILAFAVIYRAIFISAIHRPYFELSEANEKLVRLNRLYTMLSETNKCLVRARDRDELFSDICRVAVEHGGMEMAWVGAYDESTGIVVPVAISGRNDGFLQVVKIEVGSDSETVTGAAIRKGSLVICGDVLTGECIGIWRGEAERRGYRSSAAIALKSSAGPVAALTMYAGETNFFGSRLADLLGRMASDISFALESIEGEARRREVEKALTEETLERLRVMEALHEKDQLLMQQSRLAAMGEMINNIAHQWRQPLNVVGLIVQELLHRHEKGQITPELFRAKVADLMGVLHHMSETIEDFRTFCRPGKRKELFRVSRVLARSLSLVEGSFKSLKIGLDLNVAYDVEIYGYPNEYAQVLLNILVNARDAFLQSEAKEARIVSITACTEGDSAVVTIVDNAGGIDEAIIHKVFDPYFTTKNPEHGTGLGLYMSKSIIQKSMNGRLSVENTHNGAAFRIEVPRSVPERSANTAALVAA